MMSHRLKFIIATLIIFHTSFNKAIFSQRETTNLFPDGTVIPSWFSDASKIQLKDLGTQFEITDFGAKNDSTIVQTKVIQKIIDQVSASGGGVIVIPTGTFLSGALFFKPNTHLHFADSAKLKGSDDISDYPKIASRMEGQRLDYFAALINAYGVDHFSITGKGTIDGNGLKFWEAFWQRRKENPQCTNLEVSRPRLVFLWDCDHVQIQDVQLHNSGFWSSHYYQCNYVKILDLHIYSPHAPVKAPSTDAIDLDVCSNVLVKGCYMSVNDDAIALKGGKGPWADQDPANGENTNIIIENCTFGFCHSALTCGSESIHNKNILFRNCQVDQARRLLWLKMRPDTPQEYEYITVENIQGQVYSFIYVKPWTQFFDLKGRPDVPTSYSEHITMQNIHLRCDIFFDVAITDYDQLSHFTFKNLDIEAKDDAFEKSLVNGFNLIDVVVNNTLIH
ncbi:MAG: right-handed parallel beta-helix repeat-containing protein [Saprospiraceae bacterium]|nr:right-handed parallel beta-helix repeat-containing protein [Saprospiraceae bacterium]